MRGSRVPGSKRRAGMEARNFSEGGVSTEPRVRAYGNRRGALQWGIGRESGGFDDVNGASSSALRRYQCAWVVRRVWHGPTVESQLARVASGGCSRGEVKRIGRLVT